MLQLSRRWGVHKYHGIQRALLPSVFLYRKTKDLRATLNWKVSFLKIFYRRYRTEEGHWQEVLVDAFKMTSPFTGGLHLWEQGPSYSLNGSTKVNSGRRRMHVNILHCQLSIKPANCLAIPPVCGALIILSRLFCH